MGAIFQKFVLDNLPVSLERFLCPPAPPPEHPLKGQMIILTEAINNHTAAVKLCAEEIRALRLSGGCQGHQPSDAVTRALPSSQS